MGLGSNGGEFNSVRESTPEFRRGKSVARDLRPEFPSWLYGRKEANNTEEVSENSNTPNAAPESASVWIQATSVLKQQLDPQIYAAWIKPLQFGGFTTEKISGNNGGNGYHRVQIDLVAPNKFCRDHVEKNYCELIATTLANLTECDNVVLKLRTGDAASIFLPTAEAKSAEAKSSPSSLARASRPSAVRPKRVFRDQSYLNPKYAFNNFVVGSCNQFAHAVSSRVAESLGSAYNPLFIYGGVGLGKTHLANAIGNCVRARGKRVLFISSEIFVNELISSIRGNRMQEFKDKFRSLDLLIIDDIQFIIGKERTQEEFFHTFNALYNRHSQIVLTSDKVPQELTELEDRLRTRFSCGVAADLQAPDFETRVAILTKKAEADGVALPVDVARLLAEKIDSNVRELEGALNRLRAYSSLSGNNEPITVSLAEEALRSIVPDRTREITTELIQKVVAENYHLSVNELLGKRRTKRISLPRHVAMFLCRRLTTCSYPEIGAHFGGRDHSTIIHANKVVETLSIADANFKSELDAIEKRLKG